MRLHDSSSQPEDQTSSIDASAFLVESVPGTGIKLLRAKPETEAALARQPDIPRRLELLRRCASKVSAESTPSPPHSSNRTPPPSPSQPPTHLQDVPLPGSGPADSHFLQDVQAVGETSRGETVYLVISALVEPSRWQGGWFIGIVPPNETEVWQAHLVSAREAIVTQLQAEAQP
jgi:hypothetical protein